MSRYRGKHQGGKLNKRRKNGWQSRVRRLAKHIVWRGQRLANDPAGFTDDITWPRMLMDEDTAAQTSDWAVNTPNRWWLRVRIYCTPEFGDRYIEEGEFVTGQAVLANELGDWRLGKIDEVRARCNAKHIVVEEFQTGVAV